MAARKKSTAEAEMSKFLSSLNDEQRAVAQRLASTIALQAEAIETLSFHLGMFEGADILIQRKMTGVSLMALAAKLATPQVKAPTLQEIQAATADMQKAVEDAKDAQQVVSTILAFATKLAPLVM